MRSLGPLLPGEPASRTTWVSGIEDKIGRSGRLTFVTVEHLIHQCGALVIDERQDIVYRDTPKTDVAEPETVTEIPLAPGDRQIPVDPTLLFRYSALTYNGHRIHYDREYARDVEGYPGLLTHGPLQALTMAEAARAHPDYPTGKTVFDYRLISPLFDHQGLVVRADPDEDSGLATTARDRSGRQTATGVLRSA
ncbi:hypothetical protein [Nocardia sp. R6R-6]|uniref:hypothetical protein n=1 Tax=Nocardia sp. R6R-6 TaxID=3459303 RepID=UPI00403D6662